MPGTVHKAYKGPYGQPVRSAVGKQVGTATNRLPSMRQIETQKRKASQAQGKAREMLGGRMSTKRRT